MTKPQASYNPLSAVNTFEHAAVGSSAPRNNIRADRVGKIISADQGVSASGRYFDLRTTAIVPPSGPAGRQ